MYTVVEAAKYKGIELKGGQLRFKATEMSDIMLQDSSVNLVENNRVSDSKGGISAKKG